MSDEFVESTNDMYDNLLANPDIDCIWVELHPATEELVYNNVDKYRQAISTEDMKEGDRILVFKR